MNKQVAYIILSLFCITILPVRLWGNEDISLSKASLPLESVEQNQIIKPKVAIIYIIDQIEFTDLKKTMLNLVEAAKNNEIKGILLVIHSRGGAVDLFSTLHDTIKKITTIKPVIALIAGSALSGGYMAASATNYIIAHTSSDVGGIGVLKIIERYKDPKVTGQVEAKLDTEVFQAGKFKALSYIYGKKLSEEDKKYLREQINKIYGEFLKIIIKDRKVSLENYKEWADGQCFLAPEALGLGLIDEIGTIFDAEHKMIELISERNQNSLFDKDIVPVFYDVQKDSVK